MEKQDLENYKILCQQIEELHQQIADKATKIAMLKNEYLTEFEFIYDYVDQIKYNGKDWEVLLVLRSSCGSDESEIIYVSNEELLLDIDELEEKFKLQLLKKG